jgi:hypothetical protein
MMHGQRNIKFDTVKYLETFKYSLPRKCWKLGIARFTQKDSHNSILSLALFMRNVTLYKRCWLPSKWSIFGVWSRRDLWNCEFGSCLGHSYIRAHLSVFQNVTDDKEYHWQPETYVPDQQIYVRRHLCNERIIWESSLSTDVQVCPRIHG